MQRTEDLSDGRVYVYTDFEPAHARRVYANFEQPDLKAEFTFHVTVPQHWIVLSNQPAPDPEPVAGRRLDTAVWRFPATPRISTYLTVLAAGEFHLVRETHTTPSGRSSRSGWPAASRCWPYLEPDDVFTITRQGFDYFTELFGMPTRSPSTTRSSCPTALARWRTSAASHHRVAACSGPR